MKVWVCSISLFTHIESLEFFFAANAQTNHLFDNPPANYRYGKDEGADSENAVKLAHELCDPPSHQQSRFCGSSGGTDGRIRKKVDAECAENAVHQMHGRCAHRII